MPSPVRTLFVAFQLAALAAFLIFGATLTVVPVLASPIPMPIPSALDFSAPGSVHNTSDPDLANESTLDARNYDPTALSFSRRQNTAIGNVNLLNTYFGAMEQHAQNFNKLTRQAQTASASGSSFPQQCAYELTGFQTQLASFQSLVAQMGSDKGLANYDKNNAVETLLKNVVNANKDMLSDVDAMVYELPIVGSTLGPIVYEIKCILDELLDAVENLTDQILNTIAPMLSPVIEMAATAACKNGITALGICLEL
ncbi:hypothetical protein EUX98_g83 [Antrodiella citrinella]|uniref:Uncharacterized protein n=1 Tax=Antrodiella citrinella TaxID=2447956 RepID=A0A4S4N4P2_9APHY|nr:hypothetical protein EUX98_g83 [Antrodiella citrinella]